MDSVLTTQHITPEKRAQAKRLRKEMTGAEKRLWQHPRANRFHGLQFRRQQVLDGFIADFYCHAYKLVIEVDGPIHENQAEYDRERDYVIAGRDLIILRVTNDEVMRDLPGVLARIRATTQQVGPPPF